ncbi:MAG: hypothetical protein EXR36_09155 [Betaproteobacteria bacterium]|nr:hypothetical protein [Betaproteobacteria bacterium]
MIVVIMGVSGCGKTAVGQFYADSQGWKFLDADNYHSSENIAKMGVGTPLQDEDRWPWLDRLNALLKEISSQGGSCVLACSALKQRYRDRIAQGIPSLRHPRSIVNRGPRPPGRHLPLLEPPRDRARFPHQHRRIGGNGNHLSTQPYPFLRPRLLEVQDPRCLAGFLGSGDYVRDGRLDLGVAWVA